jgi:CHASE3 domain sensor protein
MAQQSGPDPIDDRLAALLETEQRLEARSRDAESACRAKLEAAQGLVLQAREAGLEALEAAANAEARGDAAAHEAALRAIAEERSGWLAKLSTISDEQLDRLARKALERALATGGAP